MKSTIPLVIAVALGSSFTPVNLSCAQGTAFTYQGRLVENGAAANGLYDLSFSAWVAASGPSQVGGTLSTNGVPVSNGLFTVTLDFGPGIFTGPDRWLDIGVRTNGSGVFATLAPRQKLTATPYAITAGNLTGVVPNAGVGGTYSSAVTFSNPANSFTGNGGGLTNVNALTLGGIGNNGFWRTTGNAGTTPGPNFLGTTDNQPLELRVNATRALRLEAIADDPNHSNIVNVAGGSSANFVAPGVSGGTIAGGGAKSFLGTAGSNAVMGDFGTVGGGFHNISSGSSSTVAGGYANTSSGPGATIGGGSGNMSTAHYTTVAGGANNSSSGDNATVGGGSGNASSNNFATVAGGLNNSVTAGGGFIGGGEGNVSSGDYATVGGGYGNASSNNYATVGGGLGNISSGQFATVGGGGGPDLGELNTAAGDFSTVAGGIGNAATNLAAAVAGGAFNQALGQNSFVGGGASGTAAAFNSAILGGIQNVISAGADDSAIGGGSNNVAQAPFGTIAGGQGNGADSTSLYSAIGGGRNNQIRAGISFFPLFLAADACTIAGGADNLIDHRFPFDLTSASTIAGGQGNTIQLGYAHTIAGGVGNQVGSFQGGTVSGGEYNTIVGDYGTIPGGLSNSVVGFYSLAAGRQAKANHQGSFVWADSDSSDFASTANDQFSIRARGGVRISDNTPNFSFGSTTRQMLMLWGGVYGVGVQSSTLYFRTGNGPDDGFAWYQSGVHSDDQFDAGTGGTQLMRLDRFGLVVNGTFINASDRNSKENFEPVDSREVLDKVAALPLSKWNYKLDGSSRHLGPMAQDFYAAFGVGPDDKHIATVDADGVALAAIQGLNQKLTEELKHRDAENAELKQRLEALEKIIRHQKSK